MRINYFDPIIGDDKAYWTIHYRDVPNPFRLEDAFNEIDAQDCPLLTGVKDKVTKIFDKHYRRHEINAETYQDFLEMLEETLLINADKFEGYLELLNSEMMDIGFERIETRTKTVETMREKTGTSSSTINDDMITSSSIEGNEQRDATKSTESTNKTTGLTSSTTDEDTVTSASTETDEQRNTNNTAESTKSVIDIPADNPLDDKPTSREKEDGSSTVVDSLITSQTSEGTQARDVLTSDTSEVNETGTITETDGSSVNEMQTTAGTQERDVLSSGSSSEDEIGTVTETDEYIGNSKDMVRNLEYLGMYLDKSRSFSEVFLTSFKNCFMNAVAWYVI